MITACREAWRGMGGRRGQNLFRVEPESKNDTKKRCQILRYRAASITSPIACYVSYAVVVFLPPHFYFPASGQAVVTGVVPSSPRFSPSIFIAHRVQQSHCSSIFRRVLPTHALAHSASQFVPKKKSQQIYTSMHSAGLELTKLT